MNARRLPPSPRRGAPGGGDEPELASYLRIEERELEGERAELAGARDVSG
jgi:hypothetical protein